jgi:dUTP pyrophosphatase
MTWKDGEHHLPWDIKPTPRGFEFFARLEEPVVIMPGCHAVCSTGWAAILPEGCFFAEIAPGAWVESHVEVFLLPQTGSLNGRMLMFLIANSDKESPLTLRQGDSVALLRVRGLVMVRKTDDPSFPPPARATSGSAGLDLRACISGNVTIMPGDRHTFRTGWAFAIPPGHEGQVRPRSGLAVKHGVTLVNAPGTIDSDYRGEVTATLINLGGRPYTVKPRDRICQMILARTESWEAEVAEAFADETERGEKGHGSTGR